MAKFKAALAPDERWQILFFLWGLAPDPRLVRR